METHPTDRQPTSPNSTSSSSSSSYNATTVPLTTTSPNSTASPSPVVTPKLATVNTKPIDSNPYPTTFIQADTSSFKQVVQLLTGSAATAAKHVVPPPPQKNALLLPPKRPATFKLYERRNGLKNLKTISPLAPTSRNSTSAFSPRRRQQQLLQLQQQQLEILSPSVLDFPALALSPVTPLNPDPFYRSPQLNSAAPAAVADEERAIAERGFYLHPSPRSAEPPRLLPLFPVTSPRACPSSAAAAATRSFR